MTPRQPDRDHISRPPGANSRPETGNMRFGCELFILHSENLFSYFLEKGPFSFRALFPGSSPAIRRRERKRVADVESYGHAHYELRCRECGRRWGNQPRSICDECFSPLEITYDYDSDPDLLCEGTLDPLKAVRARIAQRRAEHVALCRIAAIACRFRAASAGRVHAFISGAAPGGAAGRQ